MDGRQKESTATIEDRELEVFVRSRPEELGASELQRVAGGSGTSLVPSG